MALHGLTYAGLSLTAPHIRARDVTGALAVPERLGENVPVPGKHGALRVARKRYGGRIIPVEIRVHDCTPTGAVAADRRAQLDANLDELTRALALDEGLLVHTMADGTVRQLLAEVRASIEGERTPADTRAVLRVAFETAEAFWRAASTTTSTLTLADEVATPLPAFAASTAPVDDLVLTFGPGPAPMLTDVPSGRWIAYDAAIPAGRTLVLDCGQMTGTGTGGLVFDRTLLRTSGGGSWFELSSPRVGAPTVRLDLNGAPSMSVTLAGRLAWLV